MRVRERKLLSVSENGKQRALARGLIQESRGPNRPPKSEHRLGWKSLVLRGLNIWLRNPLILMQFSHSVLFCPRNPSPHSILTMFAMNITAFYHFITGLPITS